MTKIAIVRVRGSMGVRRPAADALKQWKLTRVNHCILLEDAPSVRRTLVTVKDLVTWGEASGETVALLEKKGREPFRLNPPRKGYGGIKLPFPKGALGNRGEKINDLIKRML
jgi:large subunit ribosomal protein L30